MREVYLSLSQPPFDKNKYYFIDLSSGKEILLQGGMTLKRVDENGIVHRLSCCLSNDYFFDVIEEGLKSKNEKSPNIIKAIIKVLGEDDIWNMEVQK